MFKKINPTHNKLSHNRLCGGINFYQILITIVAVILTSAAITYGWTAPTGGPPGNDVVPPINTGLIGQIKEGGLSVANTPTISNIGFRVISGNLAIGSSSAVSKSGIFEGLINARDVWVRDANGGVGAWASALGGGGGAAPIMTPLSFTFSGPYTFTAPAGTTPISLTVNINTSGASNSAGIMEARWLNSVSGVVKDWTRISGTNVTWGRDGGSGMIDSELATIPFITGSTKIEFRGAGWGYTAIAIAYSYSGSGSVAFCSNGTVPGEISYGAWSACNIPNPDCSGAPYYGCSTVQSVNGTQTRPIYTCQSDGTLLTTGSDLRSCSSWGTVCLDVSYCYGG